MYHKMRLLVFGITWRSKWILWNSQDYLDEDDGSFRIFNWRIKKEIFILITIASSYDDHLDIVDVNQRVLMKEQFTGQSDQ